ncbi:hypothetical protein [Martelella soudanensis]|uniref:hypothetical protein n=1 Tax=unclassified Martelella TaxID=2629616 RepID=UPI0015DDEA7A|nr:MULTISPECIES: hypothetical protein [unclassified Martelella]
MTNVYAWPPVGAVGSEWSRIAPVNRSRSLISGRRYVSAHARERRVVTLEATALTNGAMGAGYMEMLKRFLQGGEHLVRLYNYAINSIFDDAERDTSMQSYPVSWEDGGDPVDWEDDGAAVKWFTGGFVTGTGSTAGGLNFVTVSGYPPNSLVALPGEFLTFYGASTVTTQIVAPAYSNASGGAIVRVFDALVGSGVVSIGTRDTGVFEVLNLPRSVQPLEGDWKYTWSFQEVFADEVPGGFTEVDPWN